MKSLQVPLYLVLLSLLFIGATCPPREEIVNHISFPPVIEHSMESKKKVSLGAYTGDLFLMAKESSYYDTIKKDIVYTTVQVENKLYKGICAQISPVPLASFSLVYSEGSLIGDFRLYPPTRKVRLSTGPGIIYTSSVYPFYGLYVNFPNRDFSPYLFFRYLTMPNIVKFTSSIRDSFLMTYRVKSIDAGIGVNWRVSGSVSFAGNFRTIYIPKGLKDFDERGNIIDAKKLLFMITFGIWFSL